MAEHGRARRPPRDFERERVRGLVRRQLFEAEHVRTHLGRFEVHARIGRGAFSDVYSGRDPKLDRPVALKVLRRGRLDEAIPDSMRQRLIREGKALASLSHPNVLPVFEIGAEGEDIFLAMELVEGQDLAGWLREASRSWQDIARVLRDAAAGLAAAHAIGLVHRDVKPANLLVDGQGRVRVADFGLVQPDGRAEASSQSPGDELGATLTRTGAMAGTPAYMAPEQWRLDGVDARTDQFAFCVTFFEALHGHRPFAGDTEAELAANVVAGRVVPSVRADLPGWVDDLVRRGLRPDPSERHATMTALLAALADGDAVHQDIELARRELGSLDANLDAAAFARHAAAAQAAFERVLEKHPDDSAARLGREEVLVRWSERDLADGALAAAGQRVSELAPATRRGFEERLAAAHLAAEQKDDDVVALAALRRDDDPNVEIRFKIAAIASQAPLYGVVFCALGAAGRAGLIDLSSGLFALLFGVHAAGHIVVTHTWRERFMPNRQAQRLVEVGALNLGGTTLMFAFGWWMNMPAATVLVFIQLMLCTFWSGAALFGDRRTLGVATVAGLAAAAMAVWPTYAVDFYGLATAAAFAQLAWLWWRDAKAERLAT